MLDQAHLTEQYLLGYRQAPLTLTNETPFYLYYEDSDHYRYRLHKPTNVLYLQNRQTLEWEWYSSLEN